MGRSGQSQLESKLWHLMRDGIRPLGAHIQRIESGATGLGIPDVECAYQGAQFWCELKIVDGNKIHFQPGQPSWLRKRWDTGCLSWVLARKTLKTSDELFVWPGSLAIDVYQHGISVEPYFHTKKVANRGSFPWQTILECMCERV